MMWNELYNQSNQPTLEDVKKFVNNKLYNELCLFLENTYKVSPKMEYSKCSMQQGWNIKYKKSGKSLCTIYPVEDYFIILVVVGSKEEMEVENMISSCSEYIQNLFKNTPSSCGGRWLMIEVRESSTLEDVLKLIQIRVKQKKK
ncbi:putative nucleic acid-binding Zn finger protein [Clostridium tetanomorphum]|uniref:DUF3788 domain-containing protein n=1 Tax=Clostridium tetanomorphum TaxID=1553 RepID=UPI00044652E9|nr:DUF3788 domain-containing protein [Clostridium tetanomorphum]KAJ51662.1 hypothetical protein CTM_11695 [Clostridium tetanomorphum DSM 665]KAJ51942.1 hypothetical protein CTM_10666 [Clostridium tetanomorphum DSM 665]MBP1864049.1 putative nucleic acid-binding Zn finger protein [Clostridium tetanomorphum]NRS84462.1 putative nucleic acid-binding Zn finger protein [Clostridium tetanomorphum]SQB92042.1 Protein of uncharacterised function (DUF3788) [Clostridium tetanomorphum]